MQERNIIFQLLEYEYMCYILSTLQMAVNSSYYIMIIKTPINVAKLVVPELTNTFIIFFWYEVA